METPSSTSSLSATPTGSIHPSSICASEIEKVKDTLPTQPPEFSAFSSSYYDTHPRTAEDPLWDCAWISEIPKDYDDLAFDYWNETYEWFYHTFDPVQERDEFDAQRAYQSCIRENEDRIPCAVDFESYVLDSVASVFDRPVQDESAKSGAAKGGVHEATARLPAALLLVLWIGVMVVL